MKRQFKLLFSLFYLTVFFGATLFLFPQNIEAQITPTPMCICTPGSERYDCYNTIPDGWCQDKSKPGDYGRGMKQVCNADCMGWSDAGVDCYQSCNPPKPIITPVNFSFQESVGEFNEFTEGEVHSGTRDISVDESNPNNYGAVSALVPAGGPNHELRVQFVQDRGEYEVRLTDGTTKRALTIWNECTNNGNLNAWRDYLELLDNCDEWGLVPNTYRKLATEPAPKVLAKTLYYRDEESPFVMSWGVFAPIEWIIKFFQNIFCSSLGWFCPDSSLELRNPDNAPGWLAKKPNIPKESISNAKLLRQWLLPKDMPLGDLPQGNDSYFDTTTGAAGQMTNQLLDETGEATRETSADAGLFKIFQPMTITPTPAFCAEDRLSPPEGCASDYYFALQNASPGTCTGNLCYTDTPDQETYAPERPVDDRPLYLRSGMDFFQESLWPF